MELIQIGEDALKVTLTREDMQRYDIAFERLDYENTETRHAIWDILEEAKRTLGFEAARDRLYIQVFAGSEGGCELFVRRAESENASSSLPKLFRFPSTHLLLAACKALAHSGFFGESRAYHGDDDCFYLALAVREAPKFLTELGESLPYGGAFLSEHSILLCESAVATLGSLE